MVLSWSLGDQGRRASSQAKYDFRLDEQDWEKVCWGRLPKGDARSRSYQLSRRAKWAAVLRRAATPEGGSWREDFAAADMTPGRLQALARVIDAEFFQGSFHRSLDSQTGRRVGYVAGDCDHVVAVQADGAAATAASAPWSPSAAPLTAASALQRRRFRWGLAPLQLVAPQPPLMAVETATATGSLDGSRGAGSAAASGSDGGGGGGSSRGEAAGGAGRWGWLGGLLQGRGGRGSSGRGSAGGRAAGCGRGGGPGAQGGSPPVMRIMGPSATYLHEEGRVVFWRQVWDALSPTVGRPVRLDGVVCTSKLSWLAHTLGHEMLHAMIFGMCGPYARDAPRNMSLEGHGYNFLVLNWYILGHRGHMYDIKGWKPPKPLPLRL
ncbi:hypothetical protein GPECTOR_58g583 [Gonium pectorale]|uniref:SprT-like domain-containing protein n=1 Tax=Gonium pectorale TaxID=33097 RepID=A0A150G5N7_GONPE|nr:hypothetical protein GPECTOR_58g583 [Gonium pectorale]|eukprot:KXZ45134.1 hypothetical protein GPECTOR_58g583 [Gonium pectorale]